MKEKHENSRLRSLELENPILRSRLDYLKKTFERLINESKRLNIMLGKQSDKHDKCS